MFLSIVSAGVGGVGVFFFFFFFFLVPLTRLLREILMQLFVPFAVLPRQACRVRLQGVPQDQRQQGLLGGLGRAKERSAHCHQACHLACPVCVVFSPPFTTQPTTNPLTSASLCAFNVIVCISLPLLSFLFFSLFLSFSLFSFRLDTRHLGQGDQVTR